eukprot:1306239-Pyramimonas_sp.AAC.1
MDHASEDAKRVHRTGVDRFRAILSRELDVVKSHHALVELVHKGMYMNWQDWPNIADGAPNIEACMQYVLQSQSDAQFRGQQFTVDALRHSATEEWALH